MSDSNVEEIKFLRKEVNRLETSLVRIETEHQASKKFLIIAATAFALLLGYNTIWQIPNTDIGLAAKKVKRLAIGVEENAMKIIEYQKRLIMDYNVAGSVESGGIVRVPDDTTIDDWHLFLFLPESIGNWAGDTKEKKGIDRPENKNSGLIQVSMFAKPNLVDLDKKTGSSLFRVGSRGCGPPLLRLIHEGKSKSSFPASR